MKQSRENLEGELEYTYFRIEQLEEELEELKEKMKIPTEAPTGCICDVKDGEEKRIADGPWTSVYMTKNKYGIDGYSIIAWGDGRADLNINYCPKCGRKLR